MWCAALSWMFSRTPRKVWACGKMKNGYLYVLAPHDQLGKALFLCRQGIMANGDGHVGLFCRRSQRADPDGAGTAVHNPDPACTRPVSRTQEGAHSVWLVSLLGFWHIVVRHYTQDESAAMRILLAVVLTSSFFRWTLKYDNIAKPFAFLCVSHFFRAFPTPEKIMLQVTARVHPKFACCIIFQDGGCPALDLKAML